MRPSSPDCAARPDTGTRPAPVWEAQPRRPRRPDRFTVLAPAVPWKLSLALTAATTPNTDRCVVGLLHTNCRFPTSISPHATTRHPCGGTGEWVFAPEPDQPDRPVATVSVTSLVGAAVLGRRPRSSPHRRPGDPPGCRGRPRRSAQGGRLTARVRGPTRPTGGRGARSVQLSSLASGHGYLVVPRPTDRS